MSTNSTAASLKTTLAARPGAVWAPLPSAPGVLIYKVMEKMFAILEMRRIEAVILKCEPGLVEILRAQYSGVGHRSHLDRRFWICVDLNADVPAEVIECLAIQSYNLVRAKLTRKQKAELEALLSSNAPTVGSAHRRFGPEISITAPPPTNKRYIAVERDGGLRPELSLLNILRHCTPPSCLRRKFSLSSASCVGCSVPISRSHTVKCGE